jgi:hypothetical protein
MIEVLSEMCIKFSNKWTFVMHMLLAKNKLMPTLVLKFPFLKLILLYNNEEREL